MSIGTRSFLSTDLTLEKWHGARNDFLFVAAPRLLGAIDGKAFTPDSLEGLARTLSDRINGLGSDGLFIWNFDTSSGRLDAGIWNSDGSRASTCGNALRCFASLLLRRGVWNGETPIQVYPWSPEAKLGALSSSPFATLISASRAQGQTEYTATVDMGSIEMVSARSLTEIEPRIASELSSAVSQSLLSATFVQLANPHLVVHVPKGFIAQKLPDGIEEIGRFFQSELICRTLNIPLSNIGFIEQEPEEPTGAHAGVVYERGAGLTQCCGSGGCAMLLSFQQQGRYSNTGGLHVKMPGGVIRLRTEATGALVLSGPAVHVAELTISLPER